MSTRFSDGPARLAPLARAAVATALVTAVPVAAGAQHGFAAPAGAFDPAVPTPRAVLGYEVGDRFTPHHMIARYAERLAATSARVKVDTLGRTFEGREILLVTVTSEANQRRLGEIRERAAQAAFPDAAAGNAGAVAAMPSVAWLGFTVHGGEASGTEAALALMYQLAAGRDAETQLVLDSVVTLIDPVQNPDGHERHVQDVMRLRGALGVPTSPAAMIHQGNWPGPRTSHYYFDLNRDWFIHSHPETRARVATFERWHPHVAVDLHEMGSNSTYFFAPPMEPFNKNVPASTIRWWDVYAAANAAAFDRQGWPYFRREGYDEFYPGYGVSWPILTGAIGMTYEQASSAGGAIRREDGTVLTLRDAAWHHYTAAWATLLTTARRRAERVRDYVAFRREAVADGQRGAQRAVVLERDPQGRADSLAARLVANGIAVRRHDAAPAGLAPYPHTRGGPRAGLGAYVVDFAQPRGRMARALLEPDARLDSTFIAAELESRRAGRPDRFYDITAWSLPYAFRVRAWSSRAPVPGGVAVEAPGPRVRTGGAVMPGWTAEAPRHGFAFAAGGEASTRLLAALLADSVRVWYAPRAFRVGDARFPQGAFVVRAAGNREGLAQRLGALSQQIGAPVTPLASALVDEGTDLGSNSVFPLRAPRAAILGGAPVQGNSFGFAWYAFEQRLGYPVTPVNAEAVSGGALAEFDVLVVPSASPATLDRVLGDGGRDALARWVRAGGVLITIDAATSWLATERLGVSRLRLRRDSTRADSTAGAPLPVEVPGAVVRAITDTLSPLLAGVNDTELAVPVSGDRVYAAPRDVRPGEVAVRLAPAASLRIAGYLWPEAPARLGGTPYVWTERVGRGRVVGFASDPNFRDLWRGLLPLFANAVFFGPSF